MAGIELNNLQIGYNKRKPAFPYVSASVNISEFVILIGRNGIGKSTLLRTIAGLLSPLSGTVTINNKNLSDYTQSERAKLVSFVSTERINVADLTVFEMVGMGRYTHTGWLGHLSSDDVDKINYAINIVGIGDLKDRITDSLSDGEFQRASIARTLTQDSPFIILDEPTAFLDMPNTAEIITLLRELTRKEGKTILMSTHDLGMAMQTADKIWFLNQKELKQGTTQNFTAEKGFDELFDNVNVTFNYNTRSMEIKF